MQERELLKLMLEHQDKLNSQIHQNWREQNFPWWRAIWMECAELMDCFPWKWWADRKKEPDWDNVKIELVDIWHFILSWLLQVKNDLPRYYRQLEPKIISRFNVLSPKNCKNLAGDIERLVQAALQGRWEVEDTFGLFFLILKKVGLNFSDLAKLYFAKNILNRFRQEHGLKEGKYQRIWNGMEDNKVMLRLIENLEVLPLEEFERKLWECLEAEYAKCQS